MPPWLQPSARYCSRMSPAVSYPINQVSQFSTQPSPEYMRAIQTLRNVIADPVLGTSAETVCATMLMAYYEVRQPSSLHFFNLMPRLSSNRVQMMAPERRPHQYIAHAGSASKLISVRGPGRVRTDFEYNLFRSQRGRIASIMVSLSSCQH